MPASLPCGGEGRAVSIVIEPDPGTITPAISHFGHGILTFHLPCLFSTEPGAELMVNGRSTGQRTVSPRSPA